MPINQNDLVSQIQIQAGTLQRLRQQQQEELPLAVKQYRETKRENWLSLEQLARGKQAAALPVEALDLRHTIATAPDSYLIVATDGSAIPPDRHGGMAFCQVINIGEVALGYGQRLLAHIDSTTQLYLNGVTKSTREADTPATELTAATDLTIGDEDSDEEGQGQLLMLDAQMSVDELRVALRLVNQYQATLSLRDGPLTLWASSILNSQEGKALTAQYLALLNQFTTQGIPVIGYTSNPRSDVVITALRFMSRRNRAYQGLVDADLFWQLLAVGEASPAFRHSARHPKDTALTEQIYFMYLKTETELVRLEFSREWLAKPELDQALAIIWNQLTLGQGYPVALMEAHESAVLRGADREMLRILLEDYQLVTQESQKGLSKRLRGV